jgi:hypothetical protein
MRILKMRFIKGTRWTTIQKAEKALGVAFLETRKDEEGYFIIYDEDKYMTYEKGF